MSVRQSRGERGLGPLADGGTVVVVGGGPGGTACAIALKRLAHELGCNIEVVLYEGKRFDGTPQYNQCAGVLSPPIVQIVEEGLRIPFPWELVQRQISGYVLHSARQEILLRRAGVLSFALRRVTFDAYLLSKARESGVEVIQSRMTGVEFSDDWVMVYSESDNRKADVVIGAFGLDDGTAKIFERATRYRRPAFIGTIVTKIHPGERFMARFGDHIHAFLPPHRQIEFGAVTPKSNHITVNIAGKRVDSALMNAFLRFAPLREILPAGFNPRKDELLYFKGKFPFGVSRAFYGDRYVVVGDAAGLLRPFKGKGVNMGLASGIAAAETIMKAGISRAALEMHYRQTFRNVIGDLPYGKLVRWLAIKSSKTGFLDVALDLAREQRPVARALFDCVSAHRSFKSILFETLDLGLLLKTLRVWLRSRLIR